MIYFDFYIDRGGTFTDIYCEIFKDSNKVAEKSLVYKLLSEDTHYTDGPSEGIRRIFQKEKENYENLTAIIRNVVIGTTIVTNALLERKGVKCALLITKGFKDLLYIGQQTRPKIFDLTMKRPDVLYDKVIEIDERVTMYHQFYEDKEIINTQSGDQVVVIRKLLNCEVQNILEQLKKEGFDSISVVFLHSSIYPNHELQVKELAQQFNFQNVSLSSEVSKVIKAVPRGQTAVLDAYVNPLRRVPRLLFMMSDGGLCEGERFYGSKALLSGPAGGVVGMVHCTKLLLPKLGLKGVIGFDMGGTSTDVSVYYPKRGVDICNESSIAGVLVNTPCFDINTVAAGGGSILTFHNGLFKVGPESSGAMPGPTYEYLYLSTKISCYGRNGPLSVTDANLFLGKIKVDHFPKIFGFKNDEMLNFEKTKEAFIEITKKINEQEKTNYSPEDVAKGFLTVANECMCRPIRQLTSGRGINTQDHLLFVFGGAGSQHCCSVANSLHINSIYVHRYASILSAYGLNKAALERESTQVFIHQLDEKILKQIEKEMEHLKQKNEKQILNYDDSYTINHQLELMVKYVGSDYILPLKFEPNFIYLKNQFESLHQEQFGFILDRALYIEYIKVKSFGLRNIIQDEDDEFIKSSDKLEQRELLSINEMQPGTLYQGPLLLQTQNTTICVEELWSAQKTTAGNVLLLKQDTNTIEQKEVKNDPVLLSVFANRFMSIAEQMGRTLQQTAISTNIKERLDYSCAIFGPDGSLIANAPHMPVHLGSMSDAVKWQKEFLKENWGAQDVILTNHPVAGGSHLPDLTVITPCYSGNKVLFYVASRGHHADIGGIAPGSMPSFSNSLSEEGVPFKSFKIIQNGVFMQKELEEALLNPPLGTRTLKDNICDLQAQIAANKRGVSLLSELIDEQGLEIVSAYMGYIQDNAEESVRKMLMELSEKNQIIDVSESEFMDDGSEIKLRLTFNRKERKVIFDFTGTSHQVLGNTNCPSSVTKSAIIYCLRCLIQQDMPLNQGCLRPAEIILPRGSLLHPHEDAAIVGGNVLTSQRITDLILKCFKAVAASQGCMNNFSFGESDKKTSQLSYYETIAGGGGAGPGFNGQSGVQVHMTNTRITDVEIVERRYPVRIEQFTLRENSGGNGLFKGGDGVIREYKFLHPLTVSLLTERRVFAPFGMFGGNEGKKGQNLLIKQNGQIVNLGSKLSLKVNVGDCIRILTPGGGGFGKDEPDKCSSSCFHETMSFGSINSYKCNQEQS